MWFVPMGRPQPESVPLNAPFKPPCQPYSACSKRVLPLSPFYSGLSHYYQVTSAASRLRRQTTRRRPSLPTHSPLTLCPVAALLEGRHVLDVFAYSKSTRPTSPPTSLPATSQPTHLAYSKAHLSRSTSPGHQRLATRQGRPLSFRYSPLFCFKTHACSVPRSEAHESLATMVGPSLPIPLRGIGFPDQLHVISLSGFMNSFP